MEQSTYSAGTGMELSGTTFNCTSAPMLSDGIKLKKLTVDTLKEAPVGATIIPRFNNYVKVLGYVDTIVATTKENDTTIFMTYIRSDIKGNIVFLNHEYTLDEFINAHGVCWISS